MRAAIFADYFILFDQVNLDVQVLQEEVIPEIPV